MLCEQILQKKKTNTNKKNQSKHSKQKTAYLQKSENNNKNLIDCLTEAYMLHKPKIYRVCDK